MKKERAKVKRDKLKMKLKEKKKRKWLEANQPPTDQAATPTGEGEGEPRSFNLGALDSSLSSTSKSKGPAQGPPPKKHRPFCPECSHCVGLRGGTEAGSSHVQHPTLNLKWVGEGQPGPASELKGDLGRRHYSGPSADVYMRIISSRVIPGGLELVLEDQGSSDAAVAALAGFPDWEVASRFRGGIRVKIVGPGLHHGMEEAALKSMLTTLNRVSPGGPPPLGGEMRLVFWSPPTETRRAAVGVLEVCEDFLKGINARGGVLRGIEGHFTCSPANSQGGSQ